MPSRRDLLSGAAAGLLGASTAQAAQRVPGAGRDRLGLGDDEAVAVRAALERLGELWVSVRAFGARGDGVADDTPAINRAIATLSPGRTLYFPAGTYRVTVSDGVERALAPLPIGSSVHMERGAWLTTAPDQPSLIFLTPLGDNILQVNIDGGSFPRSGGISGRWPNRTSGIQAYATADRGLGARNVTVVNSEIRNVETGIRADGARHWRVTGNKIHRTGLSAVIFGFHEGQDSLHNIVSGNVFESLGDTAVAFFQLDGKGLGTCAYNVVANNTAKDTNQRTAGFAFDVEAGDAQRQHHIVFSSNIVEQTVAGLPHGVGGFVMGNVSHGLMVGNIARGSSGTTADIGYNMPGARHGLIAANVADNFRGCGIVIDGSQGTDVFDNHIVNCGGGGPYPAIRLALEFDTSRCSAIGNRIEISAGHPHFGDGSSAIAALGNNGIAIRDLRIGGNDITIPAGTAITVTGSSGTPALRVLANGNLIGRSGRGGGSGQGWAMHLRFVNLANVSGTVVRDASHGFALQNCAGATLADSELTGDDPLAVLYDFSGSSGVRVRNTRCYQTWATAVTAPGTGTTWDNDDAVRSETRGLSAAIASGGAIPHGLAFPPSFVSVVPAGSANPAGAAGVSVSGVNATHFTVEFGGGGTRRFLWEART